MYALVLVSRPCYLTGDGDEIFPLSDRILPLDEKIIIEQKKLFGKHLILWGTSPPQTPGPVEWSKLRLLALTKGEEIKDTLNAEMKVQNSVRAFVAMY